MRPISVGMSLLRDFARLIDRHRRGLAALAAALCVLAALSATSAAKTPTTTVVVAAREIPAGTTLAETDLATRQVRTADLPDRVVTSAGVLLGKATGGPLARNSVLTDLAIVSGRTASAAGRVVMAVKVADAEVARLIAPGMRVVLLAGGATGGVLTDDALVVAIPQAAASGPLGGTSEARVVVVDVDTATAERLVRNPSQAGVTVALR